MYFSWRYCRILTHLANKMEDFYGSVLGGRAVFKQIRQFVRLLICVWGEGSVVVLSGSPCRQNAAGRESIGDLLLVQGASPAPHYAKRLNLHRNNLIKTSQVISTFTKQTSQLRSKHVRSLHRRRTELTRTYQFRFKFSHSCSLFTIRNAHRENQIERLILKLVGIVYKSNHD